MKILTIFRLLRVKQWIKNFFIFIPLFFGYQYFSYDKLISSIYGFLLFSLLSSSVYILNDLHDLEYDKKHPKKKNRPLASGEISKSTAIFILIFLLIFSLYLSYLLNFNFFLISLSYFIINVFYTYLLKNKPIVDVFTIAIGFLLRIFAGSVLTKIPLSRFLMLTAFFLSLFLGFGKRFAEFELKSRDVLKEYSKEFLHNALLITLVLTIMSYAFWTLKQKVLIYSIIFVSFGLLRYLLLIYKKEKIGDPTEIVLSDIQILLSVLLWIIYLIFFYMVK